MRTAILWANALGFGFFMVHFYYDRLTPGLALSIGVYAAIWYLIGATQNR